MGPRVEPGHAAVHFGNEELARIQVGLVDIRDFIFAPGAGLQVGGDIDHLVVIEVEPWHRVV